MNQYPATMATQHPDNSDPYITIQQEPAEALEALSPPEEGGMGLQEIMIDFEGKLTPYHQTSQTALGLIAREIIPGRDVRITPRIPHNDKESVFRQLMSIMSLVETNILSMQETGVQAIGETIVPMISSGEEIVRIQERINSVIELGNKNYPVQYPADSIRVIPLVESVPGLFSIREILDGYLAASPGRITLPDNMRVMLARSDSAMGYSMVSSVLSVVSAIHQVEAWGADHGIGTAPILGCGALPFRGHLTMDSLDPFLDTYRGVRTVTVQSGMRYDHGPEETRTLARRLREELPLRSARDLSPEDHRLMRDLAGIFTRHYLESFVALADITSQISRYIPKNRDRLSAENTSLGYSRETVDPQELAALVSDPDIRRCLSGVDTTISCPVPRAISFTASLYTIGMPPEFLGTGRALREIQERFGSEGIRRLLSYYPLLPLDLARASRYVNPAASRGIVEEEIRNTYLEDYNLAGHFIPVLTGETGRLSGNNYYHTLMMSAMPIIMHLLGRQNDILSDSREELKVLDEWIRKMGSLRGSLG